MDADTEMSQATNSVDREKTAPFLVRAFVKIGGFHRTALFEDRTTIPTTDEHQIFTWKDATLKELLTTLREIAPATTEFRHPIARYAFKTLYADSTQRGAFTTKELGIVYSRDILGEPGSIVNNSTDEGLPLEPGSLPEEEDKTRPEKTLEELRFIPGDYLLVNIMMPKAAPVTGALKGAVNGAIGAGPGAAPAGRWNTGTGAGAGAGFGTPGGAARDSGWSAPAAPLPVGGLGRGGGHWRSRPGVAGPAGRGAGDRDRDRDRDRNVDRARGGDADRDCERERERERDDNRQFPGFPGRRGSPPPRGGGRFGRGGRGGGGGGGDRFRDTREFPRDRDRDRDRDRGFGANRGERGGRGRGRDQGYRNVRRPAGSLSRSRSRSRSPRSTSRTPRSRSRSMGRNRTRSLSRSRTPLRRSRSPPPRRR